MKLILHILLTAFATFFFLNTEAYAAVCGDIRDCPATIQRCEPSNTNVTQLVTGQIVDCNPSHAQAETDGCVYHYGPADHNNTYCCKNSSHCGDVEYCQGDNTINGTRGSCDIYNPLHNANGCVYGSITVDPSNSLQCFKGQSAVHSPTSSNAFERVFGRINPPKELDPLILKGRDSSVGALSAFLRNVINLIYIASFIIFLFMIIIGGYEWLSSGGNKDKIDGARKRISNAIIGLFILAIVFFAATVLGKILGFNLLNINTAWP